MADIRVKIFTPEHCIDNMMNDLMNGKVKGTTTYNSDLDKCWKWRKQEANIWTGYNNEGKSLFIKQLSLKKALEEEWRFIFCSPEDFPPEEFFDDMIHTLTGKSTDKENPNCVDPDTYVKAFELIKDKFIFLYVEPPNNTLEIVLQQCALICEKERVDGVILDPLIKFARPKDMPDRDDIYAAYAGSMCMDFSRTTNTSFHLVMHQLTPRMDDSKNYPEPNMYYIKGGGTWADGFDNVLSIWRPFYATDKFNTDVQFSSQKIKKQKLVGVPQRFKMKFDRKTNRYVDEHTEVPLFDFDKFLYEKHLTIIK